MRNGNGKSNGHGKAKHREERLQIMLTPEELVAVDTFRFSHRMPSRAAAVRNLIHLGLGVVGQSPATAGAKSRDFGVLSSPALQTEANE